MALGEKVFDDVSYTGTDPEPSIVSMEYYRNKAREFQEVLNQVDASARAAQQAIDMDIDPELSLSLSASLDDFALKRGLFRAAAEGINLGAAAINSLGGRFPRLSVPSGLGLVPFVIPAATIAAFGVAAGLIVWGAQWVSGVNERMRYAQLSGSISDPAKRDALATLIGTADASQRAIEVSPLTSIAGLVKWGAIALAAWLAYQAFQRSGFAR